MKKFISLLTLFFFLHSCSVYTLNDEPIEKASDFQDGNIIVIHQDEFTAVLENPVLKDGKLSGLLKEYLMSKDEEQIYKEIHLFIDPVKIIDMEYMQQVLIPISDIIKVGTYKYDPAKAVGNVTLTIVASTAVILVVIKLILISFAPVMAG